MSEKRRDIKSDFFGKEKFRNKMEDTNIVTQIPMERENLFIVGD